MPEKSNKFKFCHDCGVTIERANRTILTNRYYCELCETEHTLNFLLKKAGIVLCILFAIVGFGAFLQKPEKPLNLVSRNVTGNSVNANANVVKEQVANIANIQAASKTQNTNLVAAPPLEKPSIVRVNQDLVTKKVENQSSAVEETVYFCGAATKKGTPCSRHVKGGGRCWQHVGKPAMLPPEKLIASR